jgi:hypothetical protein
VDTLAQRFQASRLDRRQSIAQHDGEDVDHLAVTVGYASQLSANPFQPGWQNPFLERCPIP